MSYEDVLGLLIGLGILAAVIGYLADIYVHPDRFRWLELPQPERKPSSDVARSTWSQRNAT